MPMVQTCWTLQELIAPKQVHFYNRQWVMLGSKIFSDSRNAISGHLYKITDIDWDTLEGTGVRRLSIAKRMSWAASAAKRTTTREEDVAYCLLGVFNVKMPLLYDEGGERAFLRLQEEILRRTDDQTIFAWSAPSTLLDHPRDSIPLLSSTYFSLLAPSPVYFANSADFVPTSPLTD
jgi:hypothetical protein